MSRDGAADELSWRGLSGCCGWGETEIVYEVRNFTVAVGLAFCFLEDGMLRHISTGSTNTDH
jgi:capsule polysaccharide export protein KpsC/LpsZ